MRLDELQLYILGCDYMAVSALISQLDSNYIVLSMERRTQLCRVLFELITTQSLDATLFNKCCTILSRVLSKDLTLAWRPMYDLARSMAFPKVWQDGIMQRRSKLKCLIELIRAANHLFESSAVVEILDEILPQLQFNSLDWQVPIVQLLLLFVPTRYQEAETGTPASPENWLPTVFSLFMTLVSWLAAEQQGHLTFTDDQLRLVFASGLHFFNLPIAHDMAALPRNVMTVFTDTSRFYRFPPPNGALPMSEEKAHSFSRFIVYTIHEQSGTLEQFEQLVQMIEPFFHPSNYGKWSSSLSRFLTRVRDEEADNCETPENMRLTRPLRRRFTVSVRALAMLLLFSKSEDVVSLSHSTLRYLAQVEPNLIFPPLFDTLYTAVDSVTETHRMISAMRALAKLASTLSTFELYPEGAHHVAPLLALTLPGIDVNDTTKTWFTLTFICNLCLNGVIFEELPPATGDLPAIADSETTSVNEPDDVEQVPVANMEQVEWLTRVSTAQFETWIDQYLRRVFALVDNLSSSLDSGSDSTGSSDLGLKAMVAHTTEAVLLQCSERYYPMVTRLITNFVSSITSLSAVDSVCKIVYAFANAIPEQALKSLMPMCCERITEEIENGVGSTPSLSTRSRAHSETTLTWFLSVLSVLVECQNGMYLLPYRADIKRVVQLVLSECMSRPIYSIGSRILYNAMVRLTTLYPERGRSVSDKVWNDPEFHDNHYKYWGKHLAVEDESFEMKWHQPTNEEIEFAMELLRDIAIPQIDMLNRFIDEAANPGTKESDDQDNVHLNRILTTLRQALRCIGTLIPPPNEQDANDGDSMAADDGFSPKTSAEAIIESDTASSMPPQYRINRPIEAGYCFADRASAEYKEISQIRLSIGQAAARTLDFMAAKREDDVENIKSLVKLASIFIGDHGSDRGTFISLRKAWSFGIDSFYIDSRQSNIPRYFAGKRLVFTQSARLLHNARFKPNTVLYRTITSSLAGFCLSPYAEIRNHAVSAIDNVCSLIPALKYPLIPRFLAELEDNENSDSDKMIGALRLFATSPIHSTCGRDWHYLPKVILALCRAQHEDKPQVKELIRKTAFGQITNAIAPSPIEEPTESVREIVCRLAPTEDMAGDIAELKKQCEEKYAFAVAEHAKVTTALVEILRDAGTTWRFAALSSYFLDQLVSMTLALDPEMASTLANNLTSDLVLFRESAMISLSSFISKLKHKCKEHCSDLSISSGFDFAGYATLTKRAIDGDEAALNAPYIDNPSTGWYAWPKAAKAYVSPPTTAKRAFDKIDPESLPAYQAIRDVIFAKGKWDSIAQWYSQESMQPDDDYFGVSKANLYMQLFSLFEEEVFDQAWPVIERLAMDTEKQSSQRAASEMVSGMLRGAKHWSKEALSRMWTSLIPVMSTVFSKLRPDTVRFWQTGLQYVFARRDPRRFVPLIHLLLYGNPFDPTSEATFIEATKLDLLRTMVNSWDWRIAPAIIASNVRLMDALAHPYKQVRDSAGVLMYIMASAEFSPSYSSVAEALADSLQHGSTGRDFSRWTGTPGTVAMIEEIRNQILRWHVEHKPSSEGTSNYSRGSKTLLNFLVAGFTYCSRRITLSHVPTFLPLLATMQDQNDDEDMSRLAKIIMQFTSQVLYTSTVVEDVAKDILTLLTDSPNSWHTITKTLPLICTLTFSNRFVLSREMRASLMDSTSSFLVHDQVEVRQTAAKSLTSLIKCASGNVILDINEQFSKKLAKRLPRNRRNLKNVPKYTQLVLTRHAGVLGLSCLVLAFPYTIPEWLPNVLVTLAECIDDPNPIQSTVQHTFAEFRRTHMDTWHEDRKKFTSEQLELLTDMLVSPCYYA
ncbi:hypothetical protein DL89DRAFT_289388 [Linderina pennispora]|uniref:ARM repeat-containing protein n=1 Tax=Linderina pennispora TaxID=61395 RepID=A0A1Y1WJW5_9FUNG|nr:uncharacterized protein DL89DRAFT_289388 [Linderina pennispora]ORX73645.1 hypothetical protein DL89DRAFT_289388 [Linderina pennispora]